MRLSMDQNFGKVAQNVLRVSVSVDIPLGTRVPLGQSIDCTSVLGRPDAQSL